MLKLGIHHNIHLQQAWNKYGEENFKFEIIREVADIDDLTNVEQEYLDREFERGSLYNLAHDACAPMRGRPNPHTDEWNKKISETHLSLSDQKSAIMKELWKDPIYREKVRLSLVGREVSPETRKKISIAKKVWYRNNKNPNLGRKNNEETIYKMSNSAKQSWKNGDHSKPETKQKQSEASLARAKEHSEFMKNWHAQNRLSLIPKGNIRRVWSKETNQKRSKSMKVWFQEHNSPVLGRHHTEQARQKISNANSKPYPAFFNVLTEDYIPAGCNLSKLCRDRGLSFNAMQNIKKGIHKQTAEGWVLANE